jgi:chromosome segregation ATPase
LDITRFAKIFALIGSDKEGEASAALSKTKDLLRAAKWSFTDIAQLVVAGASGEHEAERLQERVADLEGHLVTCVAQITQYEQELKQLRRAQRKGTSHAGSLKRRQADIEAKMRAVLGDARLSVLSDREIARRTGISPQTVGNWRRRLEAERVASRGTVHNGRKQAA